MDTLAELLALAKAGHFAKGNRPIIATSPNAANDGPTRSVAAPDSPPTTQTLPLALERAATALTAAERALLTPDVGAELAAECPKGCGWEDWPLGARRDWVAERLGLSVRFWNVTANGRRWRVEFVEPQTRAGLLEQAARNRPGETITLQPALQLAALRDNAIQPVDNAQTVNGTPDTQQAALLPDNAVTGPSGPVITMVSAAELLQAAGVAVRYVADPATAEQALAELATVPNTGPWGLDIETAPLPAFQKDSKAGLDPWRSRIRLVQVYPGGATCLVFDVAALGLSPLAGTAPGAGVHGVRAGYV